MYKEERVQTSEEKYEDLLDFTFTNPTRRMNDYVWNETMNQARFIDSVAGVKGLGFIEFTRDIEMEEEIFISYVSPLDKYNTYWDERKLELGLKMIDDIMTISVNMEEPFWKDKDAKELKKRLRKMVWSIIGF